MVFKYTLSRYNQKMLVGLLEEYWFYEWTIESFSMIYGFHVEMCICVCVNCIKHSIRAIEKEQQFFW